MDENEFEHNPVPLDEMGGYEISVVDPEKEVISNGFEDDNISDYELVRKNYIQLIEKSQSALDNLLNVAKESEHPRAYEVVAKLMQSINETNDKLMDLQKRQREIATADKKLAEESGNSGKTVNNNSIFVGNMKDFQQMMKKASKGEIE